MLYFSLLIQQIIPRGQVNKYYIEEITCQLSIIIKPVIRH